MVRRHIQQLGGQLGGGTLTDMLKAVLARLQTQCMPSLSQVPSHLDSIPRTAQHTRALTVRLTITFGWG
jgi:hypothetical protein